MTYSPTTRVNAPPGSTPATAPANSVPVASWWNELQDYVALLSRQLFNVRSYGAVGDGVADDRVAIQTAMDASSTAGGGVVYFPKATYRCTQAGANPWCLDVPSNVVLMGTGRQSILKTGSGVANFTRLLRIQGKSNVRITNLALDGNKAGNNATYEHNHCIFIFDSTDVIIDHCWTYDATGDGISLSGSIACSHRVTVDRCVSSGNIRNPLTVEQVNSVKITRSIIDAPAGAGGGIDFEPYEAVTLSDAYIAGNTLICGSPANYIVTLAGASVANPYRNIRFVNNHFVGGGTLNVIRAEGVVIEGNTGDITQLLGNAHSRDVVVQGNRWSAAPTASGAIYIVFALGETPIGWIVANNQIRVTTSVSGIFLSGCSKVLIQGNQLTGNGNTGTSAVENFTTQAASDIDVLDNQIDNFGRAIYFYQYLSNVLSGTRWSGNMVDRATTAGEAISWAPGQPASAVTNLVLGPNTVRNPSGTRLGFPAALAYVTSGVPGAGATWSCTGTPEGAITEIVGAQAIRRDGGAATTLYIKTSNPGGNTGWTAK